MAANTTPGVEVEIFTQNAPFGNRDITDLATAAAVLAEVTGTKVGDLAIEAGYDSGLWLVELPTWMVEDAKATGMLYLQAVGAVVEATIEQ